MYVPLPLSSGKKERETDQSYGTPDVKNESTTTFSDRVSAAAASTAWGSFDCPAVEAALSAAAAAQQQQQMAWGQSGMQQGAAGTTSLARLSTEILAARENAANSNAGTATRHNPHAQAMSRRKRSLCRRDFMSDCFSL